MTLVLNFEARPFINDNAEYFTFRLLRAKGARPAREAWLDSPVISNLKEIRKINDSATVEVSQSHVRYETFKKKKKNK